MGDGAHRVGKIELGTVHRDEREDGTREVAERGPVRLDDDPGEMDHEAARVRAHQHPLAEMGVLDGIGLVLEDLVDLVVEVTIDEEAKNP